MPRRQNQFAAGHYYHVYNRGANRERIFAARQANHLFDTLLHHAFRATQPPGG